MARYNRLYRSMSWNFHQSSTQLSTTNPSTIPKLYLKTEEETSDSFQIRTNKTHSNTGCMQHLARSIYVSTRYEIYSQGIEWLIFWTLPLNTLHTCCSKIACKDRGGTTISLGYEENGETHFRCAVCDIPSILHTLRTAYELHSEQVQWHSDSNISISIATRIYLPPYTLAAKTIGKPSILVPAETNLYDISLNLILSSRLHRTS